MNTTVKKKIGEMQVNAFLGSMYSNVLFSCTTRHEYNLTHIYFALPVTGSVLS